MSSPFQQKFKGKSPLSQGAYESAADNPVVISNQPAINAMFNTIANVGAAAVKSAYSPENRAKRQNKRADKRDIKADKKIADGTFIATVDAKDAIAGDSYEDWMKNPSAKPNLGTPAVIGVEGNQEWKDHEEGTKELRGKAKVNTTKANNNKNKRRCKGKSAGKHTDKQGKYTCS